MEERKYVTNNTTEVVKKVKINAGFSGLYNEMKAQGIDISSIGLAQCVDVYLRILCLCKNIRFATDLYAPARARLDCVRLNTEMTKEHYDKCRRDVDAYDMKDAFVALVTMMNNHTDESHKFTPEDLYQIGANVDVIFDEVEKFVEEVIDFIVEELEVSDSVNLVDSRIQLSYAGAEGWFINMSAIYNWNTNKINIKVKSNMLIPVKTIEYSSDWE